MLCLLESKGPDMTACMISSSPILLYLFKGVKSRKKKKENHIGLLDTQRCWQTEDILFYSL